MSTLTLAFIIFALMAYLAISVYAQTATSTPTPTPTLTPTPTAITDTPTPTAVETLLDAGISYPTILGVAFAVILITLAFAVAL